MTGIIIPSKAGIRNRIVTPGTLTSATTTVAAAVTTTASNDTNYFLESISNLTTVADPTVIIQNWTSTTSSSTSAVITNVVLESTATLATTTSTSTTNGSLATGIQVLLSPRHQIVVPDWSTVRVELRWTWLLHTYGFACLFFMLAFYSFFSILNLRAQLSARPYMSSINVFLCLLGISRATCFLIDPYNSKGILPEAIGSILWALAFPCLISAFGLIQLAFLQLTQLRLGPSKLRSKSCMSLVVTTHFCLTIALNIIWSLQKDFKVFSYVSQTVFICWGTFLCVTFLYGGWKMMRMLHHAPASLFQRSDSSGFENKVLALGLLANCHNLAAMTAAAAATVPSFLATPKIRITDENEQTYSYVSDNSHVSSSQNLHSTGDGQDGEGGPNCRMSPLRMPGGGGGVFIVSEDSSGGGGGANSATDGVTEHTMMLRDDDRGSPLHHPNKSKTSKKKYNDNMGLRLLSAMRVNGAVKMTDRNATNAVGVAAVPSNHPPPMREREDHLEMSLLPPRCVSPAVVGGGVGGQGGGDKAVKQDVTLMSILNHIAYVNNASEECKFEVRKLKSSRKSQIERVLQGTYASAALGFLLCIMETYRIYGPYGISADSQAPAPWPWFIFQTICRVTEFVMGCFMANITKQPVSRHQYPYSCYMKHQGGGLYF